MDAYEFVDTQKNIGQENHNICTSIDDEILKAMIFKILLRPILGVVRIDYMFSIFFIKRDSASSDWLKTFFPSFTKISVTSYKILILAL